MSAAAKWSADADGITRESRPYQHVCSGPGTDCIYVNTHVIADHAPRCSVPGSEWCKIHCTKRSPATDA